MWYTSTVSYIRICTHTLTHTHTKTRINSHVVMYIYIQVQTHTPIYSRTHTHTHTHTHMHTHTHKHQHICTSEYVYVNQVPGVGGCRWWSRLRGLWCRPRSGALWPKHDSDNHRSPSAHSVASISVWKPIYYGYDAQKRANGWQLLRAGVLHTCDARHSYVWHTCTRLVYVPRRMHTCGMTHICVRITHSYVRFCVCFIWGHYW